jgi:hypothetical protein
MVVLLLLLWHACLLSTCLLLDNAGIRLGSRLLVLVEGLQGL